MAEVRFTPRARIDLSDITRMLGDASPAYAIAFLSRLDVAMNQIEVFPRSGRVVPEYGLDDVREVLVQGYRVVYQIVRGDIDILALRHGRMNLRRRLGR